MFHAPPGTALYFERSEGWTITDHLLADMIDLQAMLLWTKSADARKKRPKRKPKPIARPGARGEQQRAQADTEEKPMTVAEYAAKTGMVMEFGEG